jgi:autotransporter-associated beta strand protein
MGVMRGFDASRTRRAVILAAAAIVGCAAGEARAQALGGTVSFIPVASNAYALDSVNSSAITLNNLVTIGSYQFIAYYNTSGDVVVGRRSTGSTSWTLDTTSYTANQITDGHDMVAIAVDGNGQMHMSWGMHNNTLNYVISSNSVLGASFAPTFVTQTATNNPTLFSQLSSINQVTYPAFYYAPDGNLIFSYRDAAAASGGGSGNGNTFLGIYDPSATAGPSTPDSRFSTVEVLNGGQTSVNAYPNSMVFNPSGNLLASWTWRYTPDWRTNQNIMYAQSPDDGTTWYQQGGATQYTLPIISDTSVGGSASQVGQIIAAIPQGNGLINQTSMAVSSAGNPIIATWWSPGWTPTSISTGSGNLNRQYMVEYYSGGQWKASQITDRSSDSIGNTFNDSSGTDVGDVGRPVVVVDQQGRVLVITRSEDNGANVVGGSYASSEPGNNLVIYYSSDLFTAANPIWNSITLDTANMGPYEPSIDTTLWQSQNILDLFYEPNSFTGQTAGMLQVLQWNEQTYFSSVTPASVFWDSNTTTADVQDGSGTWNTSGMNFSDGSKNLAWVNGTTVSAIFGGASGAAGTVTLGANITAKNLTFNPVASGNYTIAGGGFTLTLSSGSIIAANTAATISAPLAGPGFTKTGVATLTLSGSNPSLTGTIVLGTSDTYGGNLNGSVCITTASAVSGLSTVNFPDNNGAFSIFQIQGGPTNPIVLPSSLGFSMDGTTGNNTTANMIESIAGNNTINAAVTMVVGGNQYAFQSGANTLTINSNLNLGTLGSTRYVDLQGAGNGVWNGVLGNGSGGGFLAVSKYGGGTWTLSGKNTYTGATLVSAGTLSITGSIAGASVTVNSGATLNAAGSTNDGLATSTALTVNGTAMLAAGANGGGITARTVASITLGSGGLVQAADADVQSDRQVLIAGSLNFGGGLTAWQGKLDLGSNDMVVHSGNITNITNQIAQGRNSGVSPWTGSNGITSSSAAVTPSLTALAVELNSDGSSANGGLGNPLLTSFDGQTATETDVLVKYTFVGDADLSGTITAADYLLIDSAFNFNSNPANAGNLETGWRNGDFNYDGVINGDDYTLIDNAFNSQGTTSYAADSAGPAEMIANDTSQIAAPVPEPGGLVLVLGGVGAALIRRRERRAKCNVQL